MSQQTRLDRPPWLEGPFPLPDRISEWTEEQEIFVEMRDGVRLSTDVFLPRGNTERLPTVLVRTPYDKDWGQHRAHLELFCRQSYAVVIQNERGRFFSEGYFENILEGASTDGYDTVRWIVEQPWSNGKIGTIGCSSTAEHQWRLAAGNHPAHAAMIPAGYGLAVGNIPGNDTRGGFYRGGVPVFAFWAWWYANVASSERLVPPSASTQEQRVRLRKSYSQEPKQLLKSQTGPSQYDPSQFLHLPSKDVLREIGSALTAFDKYITWTPDTAEWNDVEHIGAGDKPAVPALHVDSWHDFAVGETTRYFRHLQSLGTPNQYLIIGPGPHCCMLSELGSTLERSLADFGLGGLGLGDVRYGGADDGYTKLFLAWFEHWLKGEQNNVTDMPKVQIHIMRQGWISDDRWPLTGTRFTPYYLDGNPEGRIRHDTGALATNPPSREGRNSYVYDPGSPTPSYGGAYGPAVDQGPVAMRKDVLTYSTRPLPQPVTIAGPVEVILYVSSTAPDTDFFVKLVDVSPGGETVNLCDDAFRVRYRDGFDKKALMKPGEVYKITLSNMVTAIRFPQGHRIRIQISSSNFPLFERNLNTGGNNFDETTWVVAENNIHYGPHALSHVVLPVLNGS